MFQVNAGAGAVVFAGAVDGLWPAKAPRVFGQSFRLYVACSASAPPTELVHQIGQGIAPDHGFWQRGGLDEVEPVVVGPGKLHVRAGIHVQRGCNVDHTQALHTFGEVQCQPVSHSPAAVVPAQEKTVNTQGVQHSHHIGGHGALAVLAVVWRFRHAGFQGRVTIAAQVGHDDEKPLLQRLRHAVPHGVRLRKTVQQHQCRLIGIAPHPCHGGGFWQV